MHDTKKGRRMCKERLEAKDVCLQWLRLDGGAEHSGLDLYWSHFISSPGARGHVSRAQLIRAFHIPGYCDPFKDGHMPDSSFGWALGKKDSLSTRAATQAGCKPGAPGDQEGRGQE